MKEFNIVKDYSVRLFGLEKPLEPGLCYGRVGVYVYVFNPDTGRTQYFFKDGKPVFGKVLAKCRPIIDDVIYKNRDSWENLPTRKIDVVKRTVSGSPVEKRAQHEYLYRCKPKCENLDYEYNPGQEVTLRNVPNDPGIMFKSFSAVSPMSGYVPYEPKRNGMYVHDVQKCRDDKKDVKKVTGEIKSRKIDKFAHGAEYLVANSSTLSSEDALRCIMSGGLSNYSRKKAMDNI